MRVIFLSAYHAVKTNASGMANANAIANIRKMRKACVYQSAMKGTSGRVSCRHVGQAVIQRVANTPSVLGPIYAIAIKVIRQTIAVFVCQCVRNVTETRTVWPLKHALAHMATFGTITLTTVCPSAFRVVR